MYTLIGKKNINYEDDLRIENRLLTLKEFNNIVQTDKKNFYEQTIGSGILPKIFICDKIDHKNNLIKYCYVAKITYQRIRQLDSIANVVWDYYGWGCGIDIYECEKYNFYESELILKNFMICNIYDRFGLGFDLSDDLIHINNKISNLNHDVIKEELRKKKSFDIKNKFNSDVKITDYFRNYNIPNKIYSINDLAHITKTYRESFYSKIIEQFNNIKYYDIYQKKAIEEQTDKLIILPKIYICEKISGRGQHYIAQLTLNRVPNLYGEPSVTWEYYGWACGFDIYEYNQINNEYKLVVKNFLVGQSYPNDFLGFRSYFFGVDLSYGLVKIFDTILHLDSNIIEEEIIKKNLEIISSPII